MIVCELGISLVSFMKKPKFRFFINEDKNLGF